jgi:polygalacturonase
MGTPGSKTCPLCPEMRFPCNGVSRPHLVMMANVTDVRFLGVRIQHAPDWTLHFSSCTNVHVDGCWVFNGHNPNGDGIDVDSTQNVIVENTYLSTEDDSLCVKSGLDALGRAYARPSRDVVFRNCYLARGGGLTIGSEGSGGVFNVSDPQPAALPYSMLRCSPPSFGRSLADRPSACAVLQITYENLTLNGTSCGVHIKSRPSRGGIMDGIYYRNIRAHNVYKLVDVNMGGACRSNESGFCSADTKPQLNNLVMENITFTADADFTRGAWGDISGGVDGGGSGIQNVTMRNVQIDTKGAWSDCSAVEGGVCEGSTNQCPKCFKQK